MSISWSKISLVFALSACTLFSTEPVYETNRKFMADYGNLVEQAKSKHYKSVRDAKFDGKSSFGKTAYGRMKMKEIEFQETNAKNNPYQLLEGTGKDGENIRYLGYNSGEFRKEEVDIFKDISIADSDFKHYDMGEKDYNEISNKELQEDYDNIVPLNRDISYKQRIEELKAEKEKKENDTTLKRITNGLKRFGDRIKSLLQ